MPLNSALHTYLNIYVCGIPQTERGHPIVFYLLFSLSWSARTCLMNLINYVKIFPKFQLLFTIKRGCILIFNSLERPDSKHIIQLILSILAPSIFILIYANYMNAFVHKIPDLCSCWIAGGRLDCPQRLQGAARQMKTARQLQPRLWWYSGELLEHFTVCISNKFGKSKYTLNTAQWGSWNI